MQKKKTKSQEIKRQAQLPFSHYILMIPLWMGLFLPLIVWGYGFEVSDTFADVSASGGGVAADVFLHGKQIWLYVTAGIALFFLLCFLLLERKVFYPRRWMIFGVIYLAGSLLSALCAQDKQVSFFGGEDLFQGFWVLAAYFVLFYYSYMIFCGERNRRELMFRLLQRGVQVLAMVLTILGILQVTGHDPLSWAWVQKLCHMSGAQILQNKKIYLTLYNSNYVGVMTVLLLPILVTGMVTERKVWSKVLFGLGTAGMFGCLVASGSKAAGILLVLMALTGGVIMMLTHTREVPQETLGFRRYRKVAAGGIVCVLVFGLVWMLTHRERMTLSRPVKAWKYQLTGMRTLADCVELEINGEKLQISWDDAAEETDATRAVEDNTDTDTMDITEGENGIDAIRITDGTGETCKTELLTKTKKRQLTEKLPAAMLSYYGASQFAPRRVSKAPFRKVIFFKSGLQYGSRNIRGYVFYINRKPYFITREWEKGAYHYYNLYGRFVTCDNAADAFSGMLYGLGSYRGYIWSKTIPQLTHTIFIGAGMDHFALVFPNNDYAAKARINKLGVIYNKPHSWYLQMGTESGLVAALCMVILLGMILGEGIRILHLAGCSVSIAGYLLMNVVNDSMLVTAPVFWIILGVYAGISYARKDEHNS